MVTTLYSTQLDSLPLPFLTFARNSLAPKNGHFLATVKQIRTQSAALCPRRAIHLVDSRWQSCLKKKKRTKTQRVYHPPTIKLSLTQCQTPLGDLPRGRYPGETYPGDAVVQWHPSNHCPPLVLCAAFLSPNSPICQCSQYDLGSLLPTPFR